MAVIKSFVESAIRGTRGNLCYNVNTLLIPSRNAVTAASPRLATPIYPSVVPELRFTQSKHDSGIKVCTYETGGPLSTLSLAVFAGSRNDDPAHLGTAHVVQRSLIRSLPHDTSVRTFLLTELRGNSLDSYHTRELIVITSSFMRDDLVDVVPLLYSNITNSGFASYEMIRYREQIAEQSNLFNSNIVFVLHELLHNVAFRENLGNPLVIPPDQIPNIKRSTVKEFRSKYFIPSRMAFIGHGVNHDDLMKVLSTCVAASGDRRHESSSINHPAKYYGGQSHIFQPSSVPSDLLLAFPTLSYSDKNYAISKVATEMLGTSPKIKYFKTELVPYPLSTCTQGTSVTASSSLIQYSDVGLVTTYFHGPSKEINSCSKKMFALMCKYANSVSQSDLSRAKSAALISHERASSNGHEFCLETAAGLFSSANTQSPKDFANLIFEVTTEDVKKFFSTSLNNKPTLVYSGYTSDMPNVDDFVFKI